LHIQYEIIDKKNILFSASQDFHVHAQVSLTPNIEDEKTWQVKMAFLLTEGLIFRDSDSQMNFKLLMPFIAEFQNFVLQ
jgi:hypothetical protein